MVRNKRESVFKPLVNLVSRTCDRDLYPIGCEGIIVSISRRLGPSAKLLEAFTMIARRAYCQTASLLSRFLHNRNLPKALF